MILSIRLSLSGHILKADHKYILMEYQSQTTFLGCRRGSVRMMTRHTDLDQTQRKHFEGLLRVSLPGLKAV